MTGCVKFESCIIYVIVISDRWNFQAPEVGNRHLLKSEKGPDWQNDRVWVSYIKLNVDQYYHPIV